MRQPLWRIVMKMVTTGKAYGFCKISSEESNQVMSGVEGATAAVIPVGRSGHRRTTTRVRYY